MTYTFSNWQGTAAVVRMPYTSATEDKVGLVPLAATSGTSQSGPVVPGAVSETLSANGDLVINAPESVTVGADNTSTGAAAQSITVTYNRTISTAHSTNFSTSLTNTVGNTLNIGFSETGSYTAGAWTGTVNFNQSLAHNVTNSTAVTTSVTDTATKTTGVSCSDSITQPAGCFFKVTLTANYQQVKSKIAANVSMVPRKVTLGGGLLGIVNGSSNSNDAARWSKLKTNRDCLYKLDTCHGQDVGTSYGGPDLNFATQINDAVTHGGDTAWAWQKLQGPDKIDPILTFMQAQKFGGFSLAGTDVSESVTSCTVKVDVLANSADTCSAPAPKTVSPTTNP